MSEFFVRRPIVAIVIAILMTLIGGVCILALPIAQYPQIAPPEIQVQTHYTGADALTIEQSVAAPIEQQMSGVDNMNYMYSINANSGDIRLIVNFDVATDPNIDQVLTQLRVAQAQSQLPPDVNNYGVTVKKSTTAPLMLVSLYSPKGTYNNIFLANYGYINLFDQLTRLPGIGNVQIFGAGQYAMRLWVKPDQLAKLGITVPDIISAGGIRRDRRAGESGRLVRPGQRHCSDRSRRPDLQLTRQNERTTRCHSRFVSVARNQRRQSCAVCSQVNDGSEAAVSRRHGLCRLT